MASHERRPRLGTVRVRDPAGEGAPAVRDDFAARGSPDSVQDGAFVAPTFAAGDGNGQGPAGASLPRGVVSPRRRSADALAALYLQMVRIRYFESELARLWRAGLISGEMHLGIGEEAIAAGVVAHLRDGDGLAVDHRSTPPLVARGVDLSAMLLEVCGSERGLCRGRGGHMHLFDPALLAASSGIVGSAGPIACGFALAGRQLRPEAVAVAFFGEGALNQGMLLESLNLASAWRLPVVFVCKVNGWAITTRSHRVTGGSPIRRGRGFGIPAHGVDGTRVDAVWRVAGRAVRRAPRGGGPTLVVARCPRPHGHFLGDPLLRVFEEPRRQTAELAPPLLGALRAAQGAPMRDRVAALGRIGSTVAASGVARYLNPDPVCRARRLVGRDVARDLERRAAAEVCAAADRALEVPDD